MINRKKNRKLKIQSHTWKMFDKQWTLFMNGSQFKVVLYTFKLALLNVISE